MFQDLMTNAALLVGLSSLYGLLGQFREKLSGWHNVLTGLLFGTIAIAGMSMPVRYPEGIIYDGRSIVLTLVGLFGGGWAALIAALMAGIFRASLGGTGVWAGLATIGACSAFGLLIRRATGNRPEKLSILGLYGVGVATHGIMLACQLLIPWPRAFEILGQIWAGVMVFFPAATLLIALFLKREDERLWGAIALRDSEENLRVTLKSIGEGVITTDIEGNVTHMNPVAEQLTGWDESEARGKPLGDVFRIISEETRQAMDSPVARVLDEGVVVGLANHTLLLSRDGAEIPIADSAAPIKDDQGETNGVVLVFRDQTENREAKKKLIRAAQEWRATFDATEDAICFLDADQKILRCNQAMFKLFGKSPEETIGRHCWEIVHGTSEPFPDCPMVKTSKSFQRESMDLKFDQRWFNITVDPILDQAGELSGAVHIIRDITERVHAEEYTQRHLEYLQGLHQIDVAISSSFDIELTITEIVKRAQSLLDIDAVSVLIYDPHLQEFTCAGRTGFETDALEHTHLRLGHGLAGRAALERQILHIPDIREEKEIITKRLAGESFVAYWGVPLIAKGKIKGVMEIFHRAHLSPDENWLQFLETLATQTAIGIENGTLFTNIQQANRDLAIAYNNTLEGWAHALGYRDLETEGHSRRVTELTVRLARALGIDGNSLIHIRRGALLHDIGKMGIPDDILQKHSLLNDEEWEIMRQHPVYAYDMLKSIDFLRLALDIPYAHHERWDGTGYPRGLAGDNIPLAARAFAVVDVYDALTSERPYREAWPKEKALAHIREQAGKHFDPEVVEMFLKLVNNDR